VRDAVCVRSVWVLVNTKTRRLSRFPAHMAEAYASKSPSSPKWGLEENSKCEKIPNVEPVEESLAGLRAHWSDIDMNNHINNVTYLEWVMDVIPEHLWKVRLQ
jgi:acyl-ACP thioesterase